MSKGRYWRFVVTGRNLFPLDMLRHDACYPVQESEVWVLMPLSLEEAREKRSIELHSPHGAPSIDRWNQFGWQVSNIQEFAL